MTRTKYVEYVVQIEIDSTQCGEVLLKKLLDREVFKSMDDLLPTINVMGSEIRPMPMPNDEF